MFGAKGKEVTGGWRILHKEKILNSHPPSKYSLQINQGGRIWLAKRNAYRILVGKPQGKLSYWRLTSRWEGNIK
jgi:hypothetical protein